MKEGLMTEKKTWSQRVIEKLTDVLGDPRWRRFEKDPPFFAIAEWHHLTCWQRWVAAGVVMSEPVGEGAGEYPHAVLDIGSEDVVAKVFTPIDDAPESESEASP